MKSALSILSLISALSLPGTAFATNVPQQFSNIPANQIYYHNDNNLVVGINRSEFEGKYSKALLTLPIEQELISIPVAQVKNAGASHQFVSQDFVHSGIDYRIIYTQGKNTAMGEIVGNGKRLLFEVRDNQSWQVDISQLALLHGNYENDTLGSPMQSPNSYQEMAESETNEYTVVDVMLLFTPNIRAAYPGEMSFTLMNHLVEKTNQSFVDSGINVQLQLVRSELVNYSQPSSYLALDDLVGALDDDPATAVDTSLRSIAAWRDESGADIVAMIRTHDLNERDACGRATFPNTVPGVLANVSNVGISGGSNCINTFTHEIGHNFGAGHQWRDGASVGSYSFSGALLVPGQYNTVMSSIGTGDENRNYKLPYFSNLSFSCGGQVCGDGVFADNARTINITAAQNAGLRESVFTDEVTIPITSVTDIDGDGVNDRLDAFPFSPEETQDSDGDGTGDNSDAFPNDSMEWLDTDGDGIGNNQDTDDDNDGVADTSDQLPLNPEESLDSDGDGIGNNEDAIPNNFQEFRDLDLDNTGDLSDLDDDNDGVEDYYLPTALSQSNILIVSANSNQIIEFDAQTGDFIGVAATVDEGGLTFRSDIQVNSSQQVYFIAFSDVYRLDRQTGEVINAIDRSQLATNFPAHLLFRGDQHLLVNNGLGYSYLDGVAMTSTGNRVTKQTFDTAVWRDVLLQSNNTLLVASRSSNELRILNDNAGNSTGTVFANVRLNKPEHLAKDANGLIYVSNAGNRNITQYTASGEYLSEFISAGRGGLGMPGCLTIGPDGDFYICSSDTNQVLKFDGTTGAFDSVVIDAGVGGLNKPVGLVFVGKALDEQPYNDAHDTDGDGILNSEDDLPLDSSSAIDTDGDGIGNESDTDDDGDGMPDSFEEDFGLDPLDPSDAAVDTDGDGVNNLTEYNQNTDPTVVDNTPPPAPVAPPSGSDNGSSGGSLGIAGLLFLIFATRRKIYCRD
ncbi:reprolysin-like metallopeptidase [Planctobacterium marinum]